MIVIRQFLTMDFTFSENSNVCFQNEDSRSIRSFQETANLKGFSNALESQKSIQAEFKDFSSRSSRNLVTDTP